MKALLVVAVALSGCIGLDSGYEFSFPGAAAAAEVPALFVGETWPFTFGWGPSNGGPSVADEAGWLWMPAGEPLGEDATDGRLAAADLPPRHVAGRNVSQWATFDVELVAPAEPGLYYLVSYLGLGGRYAMHANQVVNVLGHGVIHKVLIGETGAGPVSQWSVPVLSINVGDGVVWENADLLENHDATAFSGYPYQRFETPTLAPGDQSEPSWFRTADQLDYYCSLHPATMPQAHISVEEKLPGRQLQ